jgi:hypothetical protein
MTDLQTVAGECARDLLARLNHDFDAGSRRDIQVEVVNRLSTARCEAGRFIDLADEWERLDALSYIELIGQCHEWANGREAA